ncbi:actin family [Coemansia spiralis]|nr:actin family [Coemansia spiralis]
MPTYGGDEVNALVIDVGSTWTRAGFAGEDMPKAYFPSLTNGDRRKQKTRKYFVGDTESATWRAGMEIGGPLEHGLVKDWDIYEKIWEYAFKSRLRVQPEEHPVMVSEAAWNTSSLRTRLIELAFEKFNCPAFYVCKTPVLAAFGTGKHTGLVVDVGGEMASACAVYEGFCLTKTVCKQEIGGELISSQLLEQLKKDFDYEPTPIFDIESKAPVDIRQKPVVHRYNREGTTASYLQEMRLRIMQEFKETACEVIERSYDSNNVNSKPLKPFEFPDGFNLSVGAMRYALPEILFNPSQFMVSRPKQLENESPLMGIHDIAHKSLMASDVDLRPQLLNNVVIAGGSTLFPGFNDRFPAMLQDSYPGSRIKLYAPSTNTERKVTAWLGGSVLASLGTFHQLWISRAEYDEHGASIVDKKCQ